MKVQQYKDTLLECLVTLRHARTFITSREKMHPTGVDLYDKLIIDVEHALKAPEPVSTQETGVRCTCKDYPGADQFCTAHKVRPAHTAAHDCACSECVKAETSSVPTKHAIHGGRIMTLRECMEAEEASAAPVCPICSKSGPCIHDGNL